jgi:NTP pyrophosphatase (non-canonical NTP hydrolase)
MTGNPTHDLNQYVGQTIRIRERDKGTVTGVLHRDETGRLHMPDCLIELAPQRGRCDDIPLNGDYREIQLVEQPSTAGACSCDGDPIECRHEAARGHAEAAIARIREWAEALRDMSPPDDRGVSMHAAITRILDGQPDTGTSIEGAYSGDLATLQGDISAWIAHNFPDRQPLGVVAGLAEETGEVCRAAVKMEQGIRGTREEWLGELGNELADVFIKLVDVADFYGLNLAVCIHNRWAVVRLRDWQADRIGHGVTGQPTGEGMSS